MKFNLTGFLFHFLLCRSALATTFVEVPFHEWVNQTPTIVHGKVGGSYSDWAEAGFGKNIYTFYNVEVTEFMKGDPSSGRDIVVREVGGEKDGLGMQVSGSAHFVRGENVVVFLNPENSDGVYEVRGLSTGKFNVNQQSDGRECLSGSALARTGECTWTLTDLRRVIKNQGDSNSPPASSSLSSRKPNPSMSPAPEPSRAFQLQSPEQPSGRHFGWTALWLMGIVLVITGWLFTKPKR